MSHNVRNVVETAIRDVFGPRIAPTLTLSHVFSSSILLSHAAVHVFCIEFHVLLVGLSYPCYLRSSLVMSERSGSHSLRVVRNMLNLYVENKS
jgi:hypothetical protein